MDEVGARELASGDSRNDRPRQDSMVVSSAKVTAAAVISRATGFVRDMVAASLFGTGGLLDAYFVATSIPGILQSSIGSTLQNSFISVCSRLLGRGDRQKTARFNALLLELSLLGGAVAAVLCFALADVLVRIVAPGLSPFAGAAAGTMLRIVAPLAIFAVSESWASSTLNSNGVFWVPAFVGVPRNILVIAFNAPRRSN